LGVEELLAYKKAFAVAMDVFEVSKTFSKEERYSLTDQIRRSSRAVCANRSEAYRKRRYVNHFISKLTDADAENAETQTWIIFAEACNYISEEQKNKILNKTEEVVKLLNFMINNPIKFGVTQKN
jgi:four helix bundle protein